MVIMPGANLPGGYEKTEVPRGMLGVSAGSYTSGGSCWAGRLCLGHQEKVGEMSQWDGKRITFGELEVREKLGAVCGRKSHECACLSAKREQKGKAHYN